MQKKKSISAPKQGMSKDLHPSMLPNTSYILGVNVNTSGEDGSGLNIQLEPSNYMGVQFPIGYKTIGHVTNLLTNKIYYFLTNTDETDDLSEHYKRSSIGYVDNSRVLDNDFNNTYNLENCGDCTELNTLNPPLETIEQTPSQTYVELVHDRCIPLVDLEEKGLNFNINFPIKKIEIKQEKLGTTLYWNDWRNAFRYLQVGRIEEAIENNTFDYLHTEELACEDPTKTACLDVNKMLVFPKHQRMVLEAQEEQIGGNLKQGTYEFWGAYCDVQGNEITEYCTPTNPISIWDENNYIQSQTTTDDFTNYAIKIQVKNLDTKNFKYYKIAVVERNNVDNTQSVFLAGIYPTTDEMVVYTHSTSTNDDLYITRGNVSVKRRMDFNTLMAVKPQYKRMKGTTTTDDRLIAFGLEEEEEINIQPVVNLFSGLVKAQTSAANENLYKSPIATSKYKQFTRNEVQPLAIRLLYDDGGYSSAFPFVGRPKTAEDAEKIILTAGVLEEDKKYVILTLQEGDDFSNVGYVSEGTPFIATGTTPTNWTNSTVVTDVNTASLIASDTACSTNTRQEKWQIFNTASLIEEDECFNLEENSIELPPEVVEKICFIDIETVIPEDTITIELEEPFSDMEDYINEHRDEICVVDSIYYNEELCDYLTDTYEEECIPTYVGDCDAPTLVEEEVLVDEVIGETQEFIYKDDNEYLVSPPPQFCYPYKRDLSSGEVGFLQDIEFMDAYAPCVFIPFEYIKKDVFIRDSEFQNEDCAYASGVLQQVNPPQAMSSVFMNYDASEDIADLTADNASFLTTVTGTGFQSTLHNKALFYRIDRNGRDKIVFEITKKSSCVTEGDYFETIDNKEVRYVIFDDCSSPTELGGAIVDLDTGVLTTIDVSTFPNSFIIAIDAKIEQRNLEANCGEPASERAVYFISPPCGCFGVYTRDQEAKAVTVSWEEIRLKKKMVYEASCVFTLPNVMDCDPIPYKKYKMAYWESNREYPNNKELYDSSTLFIRPSDLIELSLADQVDFENYYTDGLQVNGYYELRADTDLRCQPIRHPKFPDNTLAPFMIDNISHKSGADSIIFPMGINFDSKIVQTMIEVAYNNELITKKQKEKIVGWEILRGDNSIHKSVIANGVLYDVLNYQKKNETIHFSNFPFNDLGENKYLKDPTTGELIRHHNDGESNNKFTFLSPDMFLTRPQIPTEMSLQGYMFGNANISFSDVKDHPKWTVLGRDSYTTAEILAAAEVILENLIKWTELQIQANQGYWFVFGVGSAGSGAVGAGISTGLSAVAIGSLAASAFISYGKYRYDWLKIFRDLGRMDNFASFQYGIGKHNRFLKIDNDDDNYLRRLTVKKHLSDGYFNIIDENDGSEIKLNHDNRERSVFLSTGGFPIEYPTDYINFDNNLVNSNSSNFLASDVDCENDKENKRDIANPYVSLKNYIPDQWDEIDSIKWLTTNYMFDLADDTTCSPIYGGTQVISRFSWRVKAPFFTENAIKSADKLPFIYSRNSNIGQARFYCNYETANDTTFNFLGITYPDIRSDYHFDCERGRNSFYLRPPSKFYLFSHGIVDFLVESEINCNFRYSRKESKDQFYKNQNLSQWLQEVNLPISEPNTFFYNNSYTFPVSNTPYKSLDRTYNREIWKKRTLQPNAWIWSDKDVNENTQTDNWRVFKPLNYIEEGTENGLLIDMRSIESGQFLGRYENTYQLFNQSNQVADAINNQNKELGTGFLTNRPITFKKADLGFAGTQNTDFVSTPYGHFWCDAKRGKVFKVDQNGQSLEIISEVVGGKPSGMKNWFREHLPFKILKYFPDINIDNKFKGLGLNMWWDDRQERLFITKRDWIPKSTQDYSVVDGVLYFGEGEEVFFNEAEFTNVSWTIAFKPSEGTWNSHFSFYPDYSPFHNNFFQVGYNWGKDQATLWNHLGNRSSFCVFQGIKSTPIIEFIVSNENVNKILNSISLNLEGRYYVSEWDWSVNKDKSFKNLYIYNSTNNSGMLELVAQKGLSDGRNYPQTNGNVQKILFTANEDSQNVNYFYNRMINQDNNISMFITDKNNIFKTINNSAVGFRGKKILERLKGNYFIIHLEGIDDSRFNLILKSSINNENAYE